MASPSSPFRKIGTIIVHGGEVRKTYEVAAWWTLFRFDTQTVDLHTNGYYVTYTVHGRDVESYMPSLFGGVAVNGASVKTEDRPSTYTYRLYHYTVADALADGAQSGITLDPGVTIGSTTFDHPIFCSGYTTNHAATTTAERYPACEHEYHNDPHGNRAYHRTFRGDVIGERNDRGHLTKGYVPNEYDTKTHRHFAIAGERI
jgi:hypothetical protein